MGCKSKDNERKICVKPYAPLICAKSWPLAYNLNTVAGLTQCIFAHPRAKFRPGLY